jgi:hypothetical protein
MSVSEIFEMPILQETDHHEHERTVSYKFNSNVFNISGDQDLDADSRSLISLDSERLG